MGGQVNPQTLTARESPRSEWNVGERRERERSSNRRRLEWDTNLRLNTVGESSNVAAASKKKRKQRQRGKKKQREKQMVGDRSGGAAAQEDKSIDIFLDNDDEVEALD